MLGGALAVAAGCVKKELPAGRDVVRDLEIQNPGSIDVHELRAGLATAETPEFLGLFEGVVYDYEVFDENVLKRDLERVERFYRARGYYMARVSAARVVRVDERHVRVEIQIAPGDVVLVERIEIDGIEQLPLEVATKVLRSLRLREDRPFDEARFEATKEAISAALSNASYAFNEVESSASVDLTSNRAVARYVVRAGPPSQFGPIRIIGLNGIPEQPVRDQIYLEEGDPYSMEELEDAQDALQALGVFATVEVRQDKTKRDERIVPVTFVVQESTMRTVRLGVGGELDPIKFENHVRAGWEDRNFLGGLRTFSVDVQPGVVLWPTSLGRFESPSNFFLTNRLRNELREHSFLEKRTTGFIAAEYNIFPLLYRLNDNPDVGVAEDPADVRVIGYHEVTVNPGFERAFFGQHLLATISHHWQARFPFVYKPPEGQSPELPDGLERVIASFPELLVALDLRDNPLTPTRGVYVSNSLQVAGHVFGGTVSDVRVRPEARFFIPLARGWTLATRATLGLLFPSDYGNTLAPEAEANVFTDPTNPDVIADQHKLLFRAFYSGGPNSNRGYGFREVGPHGPVGFLLPTGANCDPTLPQDLQGACIKPLGGLTLWEASVELRFPIAGAFSGAVFADTSDLTREAGFSGLTLNAPHLSVGPGIRVATPVGPFRLDVGYRIPGMQVRGISDGCGDTVGGDERLQRLTQLGSPGCIFGVPISIHIALGEPF